MTKPTRLVGFLKC